MNLIQVSVGASPDLHEITPDVLVLEGATVSVTGVARRLQVLPDCKVKATQLLHHWTVTYRPVGGLESDVTTLLHSPGSLTPTFTAQRGTYRVTLHGLDGGSEVGKDEIVLEAARRNGWVSIGPDGRAPIRVGRVNAIAFAPDHSSVMYAGTAFGGVWRSDDGGGEWWPMTDHKGFPSTLSISSVAAASNGRIFAGTGDSQPGGYFIGMANGLFTSNDGGLTWSHASNVSCPTSLAPTGVVPRILVNPADEARVYAAADNGVFRSADAGQCWTRILPNRTLDITLMRQNGTTVLYAAVGLDATRRLGQAILRTEDADADPPVWNATVAKTLGANAVPALISPVPRIQLASAQGVVWAIAAQQGGQGAVGVYRTNANGEWERRNEPRDANNNNRCDGQCGYSFALGVNPQNSDDVFFGAVNVFHTTDGGTSWFDFDSPGASGSYPDQHAFAFHPTQPILWAGNDGGTSYLPLNPVSGWVLNTNRRMATALFYGGALSPVPVSTVGVVGGLQDASTFVRKQGRLWQQVGFGDGKRAAFDAANPNLFYYTANGQDILRSIDQKSVGVANAFWGDPYQAGVLLGVGVNGRSDFQLYRATNVDQLQKANWGCIDPTPGSSPKNQSWAVGFLKNGGYIVGNSRGQIYHVGVPLVPPPYPCGTSVSSQVTLLWQAPPLPPGGSPVAAGQVVAVAVDPLDEENSIYATLGRYDGFRVVHLSRDANTNQWTAVPIAAPPVASTAFPALPSCVACWSIAGTFVAPVAADPSEKDKVYVGTESGLYVGTRDPAGVWSWAQDPDIPETWVINVATRQSTTGSRGIVRAVTWGRSVFERLHTVDVRIPHIEPNVPVSWLMQPPIWRIEHLLPVPYVNDSGSAATVRVELLDDTGGALPYFVAEERLVPPGAGTAFLGVVYADGHAPMGTTSAAIRVDLVGRDGRVRRSYSESRLLAWRRQDARGIAVTAEVSHGDGAPGNEAIEIPSVIGGERYLVHTPDRFAVRTGTAIRLEAPERVRAGDYDATFVGWRIGEKSVGTRVAELTSREDAVVVARFIARRRTR